MMKDAGTLPSHLTDKDVSSFHGSGAPEFVETFHLCAHELGQSLLQLESKYPSGLPTDALFVTLEYTKIQI